MSKGAGASAEGALKGHESAPAGSLRTRDEGPRPSRPPRVVGRNRETWILHELFPHIFRQGGEHMQDALLQRLIGDNGGNEIVNRFHLVPSDPFAMERSIRPDVPCN